MIVLYHKNNKVVEVQNEGTAIVTLGTDISKVLLKIADLNVDKLIIWCHFDLKLNLNFEELSSIFHHNKILASYNVMKKNFLPEAIGYVEQSPFININKNVTFPTWQMSSDVGGIHSSVLKKLKGHIQEDKNFDYFLNSLAKLTMNNGLLCYSVPNLIKDRFEKIEAQKSSDFHLFRFVKEHYRIRWIFLLSLNLFLYERKIPILPLLATFFYKKRKIDSSILDKIQIQSEKKVVELGTIDVIIPTIGRKPYLYDVLKDLSKQTLLPNKVIIVEQNPISESVSELNYITDERWPFTIKHIFTHQTGACNARNIALSNVESEWVFLNDDDNRFGSNLLEDTLQSLKIFGIKALSTSYLQNKEVKIKNKINQSGIFGSGNSFIHSDLLKEVKFNMKFEFGYGEDSDFGMQLRNKGVDILYFPDLEINHLKAPFGGFRIKPILAWENDLTQPKPSPTVMLNKQLHFSQEQISGYKTILFFKFYKSETIINPFSYFKNFQNRWQQSLFWANELRIKQ